MSCSTCHVYVEDKGAYEALLGGGGREVTEGEQDMLDLAKGYEEGRSRLGCNFKVSFFVCCLTVTPNMWLTLASHLKPPCSVTD